MLELLFGASLCALEKKGGGIRPIAVGNTFRRISGKVLSNQINSEMGALLRPTQLGYGTKSGCEAAIHSVREFIKLEHNSPKVILKGDYANAFNSINRPTLLTKVKETSPKAWHYTQQAYGQATKLFFGNYRLTSARGVQQGDPLGPLLFSLGIHSLATSLKSEMNLWYLDDITILMTHKLSSMIL